MKNKRDTAGDCISHPEHGAAIALSSGRLWCGHQTHDRESGGTPWLDKQAEYALVNSTADCPRCIAGEPGRHQDKGGMHEGPKAQVIVPTDTGLVVTA